MCCLLFFLFLYKLLKLIKKILKKRGILNTNFLINFRRFPFQKLKNKNSNSFFHDTLFANFITMYNLI